MQHIFDAAGYANNVAKSKALMTFAVFSLCPACSVLLSVAGKIKADIAKTEKGHRNGVNDFTLLTF